VVEYMDNPAGRLHAILLKVVNLPANTPAMEGWATVFGIEPGDHVQFFRYVARVFRMASEVRTLVRRYPEDDPELLLDHFDEVERTLANLTATASLQMNSFAEPLRPGRGLYSLRVCSSLLHRRCPDQVRDVISDVEDADDLDSATASWLTKRLYEILQALSESSIYGTPEVEQASEKLIGGVVRKRERIASLSKSKVGMKVAAVIVALDLALNLGNNAREIGATFTNPEPSPILIEIQNELNVKLPASSPPALSPGKESDEAMPNC
jgi:hypothetical protein